MYFVKAPCLLKTIYPQEFIWKKAEEETIYLTFDDGPHPCATPFVLDKLDEYNAKATFFCIGKNVLEQPELFDRIKTAGHSIGNHTQNHLNGWKTNTKEYLENIQIANTYINSKLFRPPYGRIRKKQAHALAHLGYQVVMWDVLSADFDTTISPEKCWDNIKQHIEPGSIIVFHDSSKAWDRMQYTLPKTLAYCAEKKWKLMGL